MLSCENLDVRFFLIACICLRIIYISVFFSETCSTLNLGQSVRVYYLTTLCCIRHKNPRSIFLFFTFQLTVASHYGVTGVLVPLHVEEALQHVTEHAPIQHHNMEATSVTVIHQKLQVVTQTLVQVDI